MGILQIIKERFTAPRERNETGINYLNIDKYIEEELNIFGIVGTFDNIPMDQHEDNILTSENDKIDQTRLEKDMSLNTNEEFFYVGESDKQILKEFSRLNNEKAEKIIESMEKEYSDKFTKVISTLNAAKFTEIDTKSDDSSSERSVYRNKLKEDKIKNLLNSTGKETDTLTTVDIKDIPCEINLGNIEYRENNKNINKENDKNEKESNKVVNNEFKDNKINEEIDIHSYEFNSLDLEDKTLKHKFQMTISDYELYKYYQEAADNSNYIDGQIYPMIISRGFNIIELIGYVETSTKTTFEPTIVDIKIVKDKRDIPFLYGIIFEQLFHKFGRFKIDLELARELRIVTALSRVLQCPCSDDVFYFGYLSNSIVQRLKQRKYPELNVRTKNKYNNDPYLPNRNKYNTENGMDQMMPLKVNYENEAKVKRDKEIIEKASQEMIDSISQ